MIKGKVTGTNNEPLPFANVFLTDAAGTPGLIGTQTDMDGNYTLHPGGQEMYLTASYVGYTRQTVPVNGSVINFALVSNSTLPEVVVSATRLNGKVVLAITATLLAIAFFTRST